MIKLFMEMLLKSIYLKINKIKALRSQRLNYKINNFLG